MGSEPIQEALGPETPPGDVDSPVPDDVYRVLDPDGRVLPDVAPVDRDDDALLAMYERLVLARRFDERAISLQRQGRVATYAPMGGAEGLQVGAATALDDADWLYPTYRDHAAKFVHGVSLTSLLATLKGRADGFDVPADVHVLPESIPIASQLPHAVGGAMASNYRDEPAVHLAMLGDGATSEGDFHEALNFAGVFDAPTVFCCNNNQWAISVPLEKQTASETLAQKADAYGIRGVRVDGMDPLAVNRVVADALARARDPASDTRPTLVEAVTYRLGAHTTADDPDVYRDGVPEEWAALDPVDRFESFLRRTGRLDDATDEAVRDRVEERLREAIEAVESREDEPPSAMFEDVYADVPQHLADQRAELEALRGQRGDDAFRHDE